MAIILQGLICSAYFILFYFARGSCIISGLNYEGEDFYCNQEKISKKLITTRNRTEILKFIELLTTLQIKQ